MISISKDELLRCKRATAVLADVFKAAMGGKQAPLELRHDMQTLVAVLRRLEAVATPVSAGDQKDGGGQ